MLTIKNTQVYGLERSLIASGNPMIIGEINTYSEESYDIQESNKNAYIRCKKLGRVGSGSGHDNFLSGITVYYDVKYPMYWSPEFQRYHFNDIISSQSKMHKIINMGNSKDFNTMFNKYVDKDVLEIVNKYIQLYNFFSFMEKEEDGLYSNDCLEKYTKEEVDSNKYEAFMKVLSNLPMGFEMWMTIKTNYLQLKTMYFQRKNHKLKEDWGAFCEWCESLPYFVELVGINLN